MARHRRKRPDESELRIPLDVAVEIADGADLPDGAWWAMLEQLTGLDAGEISGRLAQTADGKYD